MAKGKSSVGSEQREIDAILDTYKEYLTRHKLKFTNQRKLIVSEFIRLGAHVSAEDLYKLVKRRDSGIGLASVYRTISSLVESGLAVERRFLDKTSVYELQESGDHHDHLICMKCRKIFEFENQSIEDQQRKVAKDLGFDLRDHRLELYGWCQKTNCPNV